MSAEMPAAQFCVILAFVPYLVYLCHGMCIARQGIPSITLEERLVVFLP